jgi:hypothetical protein
MKGIYLTEESKKELENKIEYLSHCFDDDDFNNQCIGKIELLEEILSSATILPVLEDYGVVQETYFDWIKADDSPDTKTIEIFQSKYPNGVIIQTK